MNTCKLVFIQSQVNNFILVLLQKEKTDGNYFPSDRDAVLVFSKEQARDRGKKCEFAFDKQQFWKLFLYGFCTFSEPLCPGKNILAEFASL